MVELSAGRWRDGPTVRSITVTLACQAFGISQTCYRYKAKLNMENVLIADWLIKLTNSQRK